MLQRQVAGAAYAFAAHTATVELLLLVGELAQAVVDAEARDQDEDQITAATDLAHALLLDAGALVVASWRALRREDAVEAGIDDGPDEPGNTAPAPALDELRFAELCDLLPESFQTSVPEGYAHYALYPECFVEAARRLPLVEGEVPLVVGLRSIGTSLGAVVAAALGGALVTLRPRGHPFAREVRVSPALERRLDPRRERSVVVVDEGPGISGSSFGAVADWFEDRGAQHVVFLPGHRGDLGPVASSRHRARWGRQPRPVVAADEIFSFGSAVAVHGHGWRERLCGPQDSWPAAHPQQESPKYLLRSEGETYLAKSAGLGAAGEEKLVRAQLLGGAGFSPNTHALVHGVLVGDWHEEARPRRRGQRWSGADVQRLADYLLFRRRLAVPRRLGATPGELLAMTRTNAQEVLGVARCAGLTRFDPVARGPRLPIVASDNRLHPWEWIDLPDGRLLKCDAVDHAEAHDLVGPQPLVWDLAGVVEELDLDPDQMKEVRCRLRSCAVAFSEDVMLFFRAAYLAFSLGRASFAGSACGDEEEARRWSLERRRYELALGTLLDSL